MKERSIRIGTRGSALALWQAEYTAEQLKSAGIKTELLIIKTQGDRIQHLSFDKMEGKGFFTKEIEAALLAGTVDLAVHSHKDLETTEPEGLCIAAVPQRSFPEDLLLIRKDGKPEGPEQRFFLPENPLIGTSSARRKAQLRFHVHDCEIKDLRGNVPTRIRKLKEGQYDAIVLARAGVSRLELDLSEYRVVNLDPTRFVPAPAQGALAWQIRESDHELREWLAPFQCEAADCIALERELLKRMEGGCQMPFGAYATKSGDQYTLYATRAESAESTPRYATLEGTDALALAGRMHELLSEDLKKKVH